MLELVRLALPLVFLFTSVDVKAEEWDWDTAEAEIRRLTPEELRKAPDRVRKFAAKHGCTVPQYGPKPSLQTNVVSGEFAAPGQNDWAFLCSTAGNSVILILWGGPVRCPFKIGAAPDRSYLEGWSFMRDGQVVRRIEYLRELHGGDPPRGDHDHQALYDEQGSKYSIRYFCRAGKWDSEPLGLH